MATSKRILKPRSPSLYDNTEHGYPDDLPEDPKQHTIFWLREINAADQVTELWIKDYQPDTGQAHNRVAWYDRRRLNTMATEAQQSSPVSAGIYHSLNPVDPKDLGTVADNPKRCCRRVKAQHVLSRRLLMIDIDPDRPIGQPAND